jgi:hypothetical protein
LDACAEAKVVSSRLGIPRLQSNERKFLRAQIFSFMPRLVSSFSLRVRTVAEYSQLELYQLLIVSAVKSGTIAAKRFNVGIANAQHRWVIFQASTKSAGLMIRNLGDGSRSSIEQNG